MSTTSEHLGNGNPKETSTLQEHTKEQIFDILQNFDSKTPKFERLIFRYIYIYLIGLFIPAEILILIDFHYQFQGGRGLLLGGVSFFPIVVIISVMWLYNTWRSSIAQTLHDLFQNKRIYLPDNDATTSYHRFLENYRDALASPKRYFLSGFLMIVYGSLIAYGTGIYLSVAQPYIFATILDVVGILLYVLSFFGGLYCIGIGTWVVYISGWYLRELVRAFDFTIQPFNTDKCGGLKMLGNFCFGLVAPILTATGLTIGYMVFSLIFRGEFVNSYLALALFVGFPLLLLLLYALPAIVLAFILPLRDIHLKMVRERETDENTYNASIEALREEIQSLLDTNKIKHAKALQEKKTLLETLHTPYPTWPFRFRTKIFSTVLGVSGSLLLGVITAALQQYISTLHFHIP